MLTYWLEGNFFLRKIISCDVLLNVIVDLVDRLNYNTYHLYEGKIFMFADKKERYVIFDIDGTIANIEHRQHLLKQHPRDWVTFKKRIPLDTPHHDIIWLLKILSTFTRIFIVTGREGSEEDRKSTVDWLHRHDVVFEELHMRPAEDYRDDSIIKREILAKLRAQHGEPIMVFDDRDRVVEMWRQEGVRCLQVAPGDF